MNNQISNKFFNDPWANWKYILIVVILSVIVGGGILWWINAKKASVGNFLNIKKSGERVEEATKLTIEDLKNTEYYIISWLHKRVKLTNGKYYQLTDNPQLKEQVEIVENKIFFGDLNGDGKEDAAVILEVRVGDLGPEYELAIVVNQSGSPYHIVSKPVGMVNSLAIHSEEIILDETILKEGSSLRKISKYRLVRNQLAKVLPEISEQKIANWKTYRNEEYKFEFKYPPLAEILQKEDLILQWHSDKINDLNFLVTFLEKDTALSLEEFVSKREESWPAFNYDHSIVVLPCGVQAIEETWIHQLIGINYFIPINDKKIILFKGVKPDILEYKGNIPYLEEIVSTFRFLE